MNTTTQSTLEQLVMELSQDERVLAIAAYEELPRFTRLVCYLEGGATAQPQMQYTADRLIQIERRNLAADDAAATTATGSLYHIPAWRSAEIHYDPQGLLAARKEQADAFQWDEAMQQAANHYASQRLFELIPLIQVLMYGITKDDWSLLSLNSGNVGRELGATVLVQRGQMSTSEGEMYRILQSTMGKDSPWWQNFAQAVGLRLPTGWISLARMRGLAALVLYLETLKLFADILEDSHRSVIETTAQQIEETVGEFRK